MSDERCPTCGSDHEHATEIPAIVCADPFHRDEVGRLWDADLGQVVLLPTRLCRCMTCCCGPNVGHNSPVWQHWEKAVRALEAGR